MRRLSLCFGMVLKIKPQLDHSRTPPGEALFWGFKTRLAGAGGTVRSLERLMCYPTLRRTRVTIGVIYNDHPSLRLHVDS